MVRERRTAVASVVLLGVALVLLASGGFIQLDDSPSPWFFALGPLAVIPAVAAVVVASRDPMARLWLGGGLMGLVALVVLLSLLVQGFRFVWVESESELLVLEVVLGLVAAVLIATGLQPSARTTVRTAPGTAPGAAAGAKRGAGRWMVRASVYLCATAVLMAAAFVAGVVLYDTTYCGAGGDTECLAILAGFLWAAAALPVSGVAIGIIELVLWHRRRAERRRAEHSRVERRQPTT
ncbi:hypothetical protein [Kribbella sp. CA-247076]|uniref:hypothetical protein n=1 Tax=Kribbella sp. CA-247076 TaxID=3239941 RepID=UPI003D93DE8B